jgi:hypothetical protein
MLLARAPWADAYSLDALRRRRRDLDALPNAPNTAGVYALPIRAALVILSLLFVSAGMSKMFGAGVWLRDFKLMSNFGLYHNVEGALLGIRLNPWAAPIKDLPVLHMPMQFGVLLFETTFLLAMFHRQLLRLYVGMALVFQAVNALLFVVTFAPLLIVYGLFVDWESIRRRVGPRARTPNLNLTTGALIGCTISIVLAATWNLGSFTRSIFSLGGAIDWRNIFWPILPIGVWMVVSAMWQILRALTKRTPDTPITPHVVASR